MRRTLQHILAPCLVAAAAPGALAFSWYQAGGVNVVWPGNESIRALSPTTFPPGSDIETLILGAMGLWNIVPSTDFTYSYATLSDEIPFQVDGINNTAAVPTDLLDPGVLGVTFTVNQGSQWVDMDIAFADVPDNIGWNFETNPDCVSISDPAGYGYSFLLAAVHELGHGLGLGHEPTGNEAPGTPWFIATMNPRYPSGGAVSSNNIVELWTDDRNGLRYLYPPSGPSQPIQRDLANAGYTASTAIGQAIPVVFWPASAPPDGTFTARAGIQNFGNSSELFVDHGFYLSDDDVISPDDYFLGAIEWDIPFQQAFDYDVDIDVPSDLPAGPYFLISRIDDADEIDEIYEDNNEVVYCDLFTVEQLAPEFATLGQVTIDAGIPFTGPAPQLLKPLNMATVTWTLDTPPAGMTINPSTGVISWPNPIESPFLYAVKVRATNDAGTYADEYFIGVQSPPPACPGDVNADGATDIFDFGQLATYFGTPSGATREQGDLNADGAVNVFDFSIFAADFGCHF